MDKIVKFQKAKMANDIKEMLPLVADDVEVQTPKGVVTGRDNFIMQIKCPLPSLCPCVPRPHCVSADCLSTVSDLPHDR